MTAEKETSHRPFYWLIVSATAILIYAVALMIVRIAS